MFFSIPLPLSCFCWVDLWAPGVGVFGWFDPNVALHLTSQSCAGNHQGQPRNDQAGHCGVGAVCAWQILKRGWCKWWNLRSRSRRRLSWQRCWEKNSCINTTCSSRIALDGCSCIYRWKQPSHSRRGPHLLRGLLLVQPNASGLEGKSFWRASDAWVQGEAQGDGRVQGGFGDHGEALLDLQCCHRGAQIDERIQTQTGVQVRERIAVHVASGLRRDRVALSEASSDQRRARNLHIS
mmetsp:Transcript_120859/g.287122  ORF Transcript_120859/g.287122 Transcript_120859/m.287122 type:complete len:237 (+) Transcript_120859:441-1151(+)